MFIDPGLLIKKDNFKLEQNVVCPICNGILFTPVQCCKCENCFCQICLENWKRGKGDNFCPFGCNNTSFKYAILIQNILSNLTFKCKNNCNEEIPYLELENHYNDKCPNIIIDYKQKYLEYKAKYLDAMKKNIELENELKQYKSNNAINTNNINNIHNNFITNSYKSIYHCHSLDYKNNCTGKWICDIGENSYLKNEIRFGCNNCDFDICLKCKILEQVGYKFNNIILSKSHQHLLYQNKMYSNLSWTCGICKKHFQFYEKGKVYGCQQCNYEICESCKINEDNEVNELNIQFNEMNIEP